ncbi:MAG: zinc-dependent metalloprotease [Acidobacteria bacterium]|nr:zinc-dependent metalloprotease [Acidobacteriota bacterium]
MFLMRLSPILAAATFAFAQDPPKPEAAKPEAGRAATAAEIKPYDRVVTKDAKTQQGLFTVHEIKDKYYFEIPARRLSQDLLLVVSFKSNASGLGYGGTEIANHVIRWERRGRRVLMRSISSEIITKDSDPVGLAARASSENAVVMSFNIEAEGQGGAPVIDVTRLFTTEVPEFSARRNLNARGFDSSRSMIEKMRAFPANVNVEALHTYTPPDAPSGPSSGPPQTGMRPGQSASVVASYSMVELPEKPMKPRLADSRVGYFNTRKTDYSSPRHLAESKRYISRWRLEKKDPSAAVSEPVKPIVFYIDPATPAWLVPSVKLGVEDWRPAFEAAGFRNAIEAREVPKDDPDFSLEDARHSSIRWLTSTIQNAYGPHIRDPRSGEILEADVKMYHNVLLLLRNWYFSQVGHLDERAQKFPFPQDLMGELVRHVVAHEVGHSIGLPHNMKASGMYTIAQVRDKNWVAKYGHTPSLMDYSRFNYVAQPEDGIATRDLIPKIGPYDLFAIKWGYAPIPQAPTAEAERPVLNEWVRAQDSVPHLRFSVPSASGSDPTDQTEAVGDADAVAATTLGTLNLKRVLNLVPRVFPPDGASFDELGELYDTVLGQWRRELGHVVPVIGGMNAQTKHWGQNGAVFTPVSRERQKQAVQFLNQNVFATPGWAIRPDIIARTDPQGALKKVADAQRSVLTAILQPLRLERMMESEALHGAQAYGPAELLSDLRGGIYSDLAARPAKPDAYRRNLQRIYLDLVNDQIHRPVVAPPPAFAPDTRTTPYSGVNDTRALLRSEVRAIGRMARAAAGGGGDAVTLAHAADLADHAERILDPKFAPPAPAPASTATRRGLDELPGCWHEW